MRNYVELSKFDDLFIINNLRENSYSKDLVIKAILAHKKTGLKYDIKKGITKNNDIVLASYYAKDIPVYSSVEQAIRNEFSPIILNSCSRYTRGYSLV